MKILTALPVTTGGPEGLSLKMNGTLSAIRRLMSNERLESLILLQVHDNRTL